VKGGSRGIRARGREPRKREPFFGPRSEKLPLQRGASKADRGWKRGLGSLLPRSCRGLEEEARIRTIRTRAKGKMRIWELFREKNSFCSQGLSHPFKTGERVAPDPTRRGS